MERLDFKNQQGRPGASTTFDSSNENTKHHGDSQHRRSRQDDLFGRGARLSSQIRSLAAVHWNRASPPGRPNPARRRVAAAISSTHPVAYA